MFAHLSDSADGRHDVPGAAGSTVRTAVADRAVRSGVGEDKPQGQVRMTSCAKPWRCPGISRHQLPLKKPGRLYVFGAL